MIDRERQTRRGMVRSGKYSGAKGTGGMVVQEGALIDWKASGKGGGGRVVEY